MNSAVQTPDGYLWIGSTKGLIISDGHGSIMYTHDHPMYPLGLKDPNAFVGDLQLDSMGNVYATISSGAYVIRFDAANRRIRQEWSFDETSQPSFISFDVTPHGDVFALSMDKTSDRFSIWKMNSTGQNQLIFQDSRLTYGAILNYQWFQSMHWIQTTSGILRITGDGKHFNWHTYSQVLPTNTYVAYAGDHYYFYDHSSRAVMYWDSKMDSPQRYTTIPGKVQVNSGQFMVREEMLYLANGYYFFILDTLHHTIQDLSKETYDMKKEFYPGAISEDILDFHIIDQQVFLLGSKFLYQVKSKPPRKEEFQALVPYIRPDISMRGLAEDERQNVYASFYNGVAIKPKGVEQFEIWSPLKDFNSDLYSAYSLTYSTPYIFWHSLKINAQSGEITQTVPNFINGHIVHVLSGDTLWLYTWYGKSLYAYDIPGGKLDSVFIEPTSGSESDFPSIINKMINNHDQTAFWIATGSEGIRLVSKQGRILQSYTLADLGISPQEGINDLLLDGDYLWYGGYEGLGRLNTQNREYTLYKDPVISPAMQQRPRTIFTILPDERNGFYIGSHQGLVYFDTTTMLFTHLHPQHPLSQPEFNRTSAFRDSQGRFYFGSTNGLYSFRPEELEFQSAVEALYPLKLYSISIFNGEEKQNRYVTSDLNELSELVLQPSETNIEFHLSVPSFKHEIYYSYRIRGIHDQWSEYAADPKILVYALPPGNYVLEVKASANASDTVTSTFELPILMTAYWYQKTWVWVLLTLCLSAVVAFWIRYWYQQKWKRQKALEALRIKISSDLHDDVGSILSGLAMQSQVMSYEMEEAKRKPMLELSEMSREAMERMRDTVWAIDARKDKYENLIDRMRDFAEKNLERKNISHTFSFNGLDGKKFISPEIRQNIYLIFKEAITNIIRHSDARHVDISFVQEGDKMSLTIHDNGTVTEPGSLAGQGIGNMKMRAVKINGKLSIGTDHGYNVVLELVLR